MYTFKEQELLGDKNTKKTIYLHIGAGKTGSSAIQSFMNFNRKKLAQEYSCLYPNFQSRYFDRGNTQHSHCPIFTHYKPSTVLKLLKRTVNYSYKKNIDNIILSCECLLDTPIKAIQIFQSFKDLSEINCVVIAYLRRQDHWLESAWKQWGVKSNKYENFDEYISNKSINWFENLNKWSRLFGKENIIVHPYENQQLPEGLISDFVRIFNVNYQENRWIDPPKNNITENMGFNRDIIEILRLNRGFYKNIHDHRLLNFFSEYLGDEFKKMPFEHYSLLSPKQRLEILQKYEPMNKKIAHQYMGRSDGNLFYEPWPDPNEPWEPYDGLTVEKIVPIFTQVLYNMNTKYLMPKGIISNNTNLPNHQRKQMLSTHSSLQWLKSVFNKELL